MEFLEILATFAQVIVGVLVVILVLLQDGKESGNIVTGAANKGGTMGSSKEARLAKFTKIFGVAYILLTIASASLMLINR